MIDTVISKSMLEFSYRYGIWACFYSPSYTTGLAEAIGDSCITSGRDTANNYERLSVDEKRDAMAATQSGDAADTAAHLDSMIDANVEKKQLEVLKQAITACGADIVPLITALRNTLGGSQFVGDFLADMPQRVNLEGIVPCDLTMREKEVLELAASGASNREIGQCLFLQTITVAQALTRAYRKLNAKNRPDAVRKWMLLRGIR